MILLFGSSNHAKVLIEAAVLDGTRVAGCFDDDESRVGETVLGVQVHGGRDRLLSFLKVSKKAGIVIAVGNNLKRAAIASFFEENNAQFSNIFHPSAYISKSAKLGSGSVVLASAVISTCADIGKNVIVNTRASIDHDCVIGKNSHISPGATLCGNVIIENNVWIGAGSVIIPNVRVGAGSVIAAGSTVIQDVPGNVLVAGCPAVVKKQLRVDEG